MTRDAQAAKPRRERTENAARRRRQFIEATIDSIAEHGLSGTTLATVAERAELSQGSAVFYFHTKEQLFFEAFRALYDEYRDAWTSVMATEHGNSVAQLTALIGVELAEHIFTRRNLTLWHSCWGEARARPLFAEITKRYDAEREVALQELAHSSIAEMRSPWRPDSFAAAVNALTGGMWIEAHISEQLDLDRHRKVLGLFLSSVFPDYADEIAETLSPSMAGSSSVADTPSNDDKPLKG